MKPSLRFRLFFWYFCHFKVAMLGYLKPKIITINPECIIIRLPLRRRSRNHLHSMYFGALAAGADLAGGLHGFYQADRMKTKISLVFKSFKAEFLRRPESDVYFVCTEGDKVQAMIEESKRSHERVNQVIAINAYTDYPTFSEKVAEFMLELSIKNIN